MRTVTVFDLNESEIDLNEWEHFLKVNLGWVWGRSNLDWSQGEWMTS